MTVCLLSGAGIEEIVDGADGWTVVNGRMLNNGFDELSEACDNVEAELVDETTLDALSLTSVWTERREGVKGSLAWSGELSGMMRSTSS